MSGGTISQYGKMAFLIQLENLGEKTESVSISRVGGRLREVTASAGTHSTQDRAGSFQWWREKTFSPLFGSNLPKEAEGARECLEFCIT